MSNQDLVILKNNMIAIAIALLFVSGVAYYNVYKNYNQCVNDGEPSCVFIKKENVSTSLIIQNRHEESSQIIPKVDQCPSGKGMVYEMEGQLVLRCLPEMLH